MISSSVHVCFICAFAWIVDFFFAFTMSMTVSRLLAFPFAFAVFVAMPGFSALSSASDMFTPIPRLPAFLIISIVSIAVLKLSAYIFYFFYYKSQLSSQPWPFRSSKKLINIASCLLSWLLTLHHPLNLQQLYCPN